jgi:alkylation response protein AidB-like acyl-CoA dehydrogenase
MAERYHPDSDQVAFAASVGKSLLAMLPLSRLHDSHEESARIWTDLTSLGVFEIASSEQQGGSALGAAEEALIVLELGRRAVAPSVLATVGATHLPYAVNRLPPSAGSSSRGDQRASMTRVAAGYRRGDRVVLVEDSAADRLLVRDARGAALFVYPNSFSVVDTQLWSSRLLQAAALGEPLAEATPAQALRLRLIDAAALAGLARAALEMAVGYAGMREQFGRPIGTFQAVKHHCANMALAARLACDLVSFAAVAVDDGRDDAVLQVESAFYTAGSAAIDNCGKNIQIHGGMGFSDEADPHCLLKRARVLVEIAGGLEAALARIGEYPPSAELSAHQRRGPT